MATSTKSGKKLIVLNKHLGTITVEPDDEDRFVFSAHKAVEACQEKFRNEEALKTFKRKFLVPLQKWCEDNAEKVKGCYLPVPKTHLEVYVTTFSKKYDFELGDKLASLELSLARNKWRVNVIQLPDADYDTMQTFFDADGAIEVHAQSKSPQDESGLQPGLSGEN